MDGIAIKIFSVAFGGALGSVARYLINISPVNSLFGAFPFPTFLINVLGSFLIGLLLIVLTEKLDVGENMRLLLLVGFLGAFTTFSTFELEFWALLNKSRYLLAFGYIFLSVAAGFLGVVSGIALGRNI